MSEIPHRPSLDLGGLLESDDLDAVMAVVCNLATEVLDLQERVLALEGGVEPAQVQERIDAFIARVFSPLEQTPRARQGVP